MNIKPVMISQSAPEPFGELSVFGASEKAINLVNTEGKLITLHCYGHGIGPAGWLLREDEFYYIKYFLEQGHPAYFKHDGIHNRHFNIINDCRRVNLQLNDTVHISHTQLTTILSTMQVETGLYGTLADVTSNDLSDDLQYFIDQLHTWAEGGEADWRCAIGKGPGLTPSQDDMLIGILFSAFSDPHYAENAQQLLRSDIYLGELTTAVSASYLEQARAGNFSMILKELSVVGSCPIDLALVMEKLLQHGHYSGADTLLGIWLFSCFKNESYCH